MRIARKLMLLTALAAAAMALSASTASAQVEVHEEPSGAHCSPCLVTADSLALTSVVVHVSGMEINTGICDDEFDGEVNEDGTGHISNQQLHGGSCNRRPCEATSAESGDGHEWDFNITEESGQLYLHTTFCVQVGADPTLQFCSVEVPINAEAGNPHHYILTANDIPCAEPGKELTGQWEINGTGIEIEHT